MATVELFFDCSSPWTYLAFHNLQPLAAELGATIQFRPILVGGVFNAVNPIYSSTDKPVPAKQEQSKKILQDWARVAGLKITRPAERVPGQQRQGDARLRLARAAGQARSRSRLQPSRPIGATTAIFRRFRC